jgi:hypothetical protein
MAALGRVLLQFGLPIIAAHIAMYTRVLLNEQMHMSTLWKGQETYYKIFLVLYINLTSN